eukprot:5782929-Prorocentrum_lima.AAC.1
MKQKHLLELGPLQLNLFWRERMGEFPDMSFLQISIGSQRYRSRHGCTATAGVSTMVTVN